MTRLQDLYQQQGQSPWLDNLRRDWIRSASWPGGSSGACAASPRTRRSSRRPSRARTSTTSSSPPLINGGGSVEDAYWQVVTTDISDALAILRPVYDDSDGADGFVSVEVAPEPGARHRRHDRRGPPAARRHRPAQPLREDPRHGRGAARDPQVIADGKSVNITLLFSLRALRRGDRGLPRRAWRPPRASLARVVERGVVLRQPGRHRGRQAPRGHRHRGGPRPAGQGGGGQRPARLPALPRALLGRALGGARRPGAPACSGRCGRRPRRRTPTTPRRSTSTPSSPRTP